MAFQLPTIIRRRVNIDFDSARAKRWHLGHRGMEDVLNAMSFIFPPGEKFFIDSVQYYRSRITDPVLEDQVKRFIYQEAMHSKEHARSNDVLALMHPYGPKFEKFVERVLNLNRRLAPHATQLAVTCALEHFTAMLADALLVRQEWIISESDPAFASLWLWHAVEETEHKAVCFDVYQSICGKGVFSYLQRVFAMASTTLMFVVAMSVGFRLIRKKNAETLGDSRSGSAATAPAQLPATAESPAPLPADPNPLETPSLWLLFKDISLKLYFDYYRPSFHPWMHNNAPLIDEWKQRYKTFGSGPDVEREEAT
jgi:predicted metal-dependent hydrolase